MTMYRTIKFIFFGLIVSISYSVLFAEENVDNYMSKSEREQLKEEARDMFYHAYRAYMENAYPADELMPLSCKGRYRGVTPNRGDMDDILGNFSLTLVDCLDTLVILGDFEEFEHAVKLVIQDVSFNRDVVVSVFETNIRMLGGLLSAHILASGLQESGDFLVWYRGELLDLAHNLGKRLLPAFNTSTGIPHARINLKYGMVGLENSRETCTACAGTMILEMAALSRLTGEPIFEQKAHKAMDRLWKIRHRTSDLMGTVVNIHSGDWIRKDSGVGAGIDSYYEYCLKAYILLGDETYLARFNRHYNAVMKYISRGPMMFDVHMHRPHTQSRHFMDALLAFWPGLQVLLGDVRPAVETHEMLYQVMQRHTFIPEAFTADFQVHWGQHPLRPEFLESTYFLHRATGDDHYLRVGKAALKSLQKHARVPCGYAAVNDVRTRIHEDRMDSFVLAETFKYLYMMFSDDAELPINLDNFIFTTEAHLLPLSLARFNRNFTTDKSSIEDDREFQQYSRTCPNTMKLLPETVRKPLKNMMGECRNHLSFRRLLARQFRPGDPEHVHTLADMGISVLSLPDGRVQLLHTFSMAKSARDAEEGLIFMREMAELSERSASESENSVRPKAVAIEMLNSRKILVAGPAHFGPELKDSGQVISNAVFVNPMKACDPLTDVDYYKGKIVIAERGDCTFADKVRRLQGVGAIGVIIIDNIPGTSHSASPIFAMSGDGVNDVNVPAVFLFSDDAKTLKTAVNEDPSVVIVLGDMSSIENENALKLEKDEIFDKNSFSDLNLQEINKVSSDNDEVLVSFDSGISMETVKSDAVPTEEESDNQDKEIQEINQAFLENYLSSVISKFDSQFYHPFFKVLALKHKEYKNSKGNIKAVTKLIEEMTEVIQTIRGKIYNYSDTIKSGNHLSKDINENLKILSRALKATEDDNIIVRDSEIVDFDALLGKLSDQVIDVNQALSNIRNTYSDKYPELAEDMQDASSPAKGTLNIEENDGSIVHLVNSENKDVPPR